MNSYGSDIVSEQKVTTTTFPIVHTYSIHLRSADIIALLLATLLGSMPLPSCSQPLPWEWSVRPGDAWPKSLSSTSLHPSNLCPHSLSMKRRYSSPRRHRYHTGKLANSALVPKLDRNSVWVCRVITLGCALSLYYLRQYRNYPSPELWRAKFIKQLKLTLLSGPLFLGSCVFLVSPIGTLPPLTILNVVRYRSGSVGAY